MRAISVKPLPAEDAQAFALVELAEPDVRPHDLLVRVHAVALNPIDTKMRLAPVGNGKPDRVLGWDAAGVVERVGQAVTRFAPGDRVYYAGSVRRSGSNSEWQSVDERLVGRMPSTLNFCDAAALPLTTLTAWEAMFEHMQIGAQPFGLPGPAQRSLLVVGGAGGVGSVALQLARQVPDLTVVATASRDESRDWCLRMGADHVISHHDDLAAQFDKQQLKLPDFILINRQPDSYFNVLNDLIAPFGRICSIVESAEPLDMLKLRAKAVSWSWQAMFVRSNLQTEDMIRQGQILDLAAQWVDNGKLVTTRTTDCGEMTPDNLRAAHQAVESGSMIGKAVLHWIGDT